MKEKKTHLQYHYRGSRNDIEFSCKVTCIRCKGRTAQGIQCRNRTCKMLPYCWLHARKKYHVRVDTSTQENAGRGLFCEKSFKRWEWIVPIWGETISRKEMEARYQEDTAPYGIYLNRNQRIDGACERYIGHYANSSFDENDLNAVIEERPNAPHRLWLRATKNIPAKSEIFVDYGNEYELTGNSFFTRTIK